MSHRLGVHKLVLLNSGGFRFAEFDLDRPVHFAADNNGGKSTLVNALQFLLVDEFEKMVFGDHDLAGTRRHYFGQSPSYIVFECLTRSGPQCLVVSGSGDIAGSRFTRFVYRGGFDSNHYRDEDGRLVDAPSLHRRLITADVLEVKHGRLWRVLGRPNDVRGDDHDSSRLGILPIKRVEDYHSFREVFIKLLSLSKAQADELKRLLIACSCPVGQVKSIDVRKRFNDEFSRLERDDKELEWIKAILPQIEKGIKLRSQVVDLNRQLAQAAVAARGGWRRCIATERMMTIALQQERHRVVEAKKGCSDKLNGLREEIGSLKRDLRDASERLNKLEADHRIWGAVSDLELSAWKSQVEERQARYHEMEFRLRETQRLDVRMLERRCQEKRQEHERLMRELHDWDERTVGYLNGLGFSTSQLSKLFTFVNPALARASHREVLGNSDAEAVKAVVTQALDAIDGDLLGFSSVSVNLAAVPRADVASSSRETVAERLAIAGEELQRQERLLEVARNTDEVRQQQQAIQRELQGLTRKLSEYEAYRQQYSKKGELVAALRGFEGQLAEKQKSIEDFEKQEQLLLADLERIQQIARDLGRADSARSMLNRQLSQVQIEGSAAQSDGVNPGPEFLDADITELAAVLSGCVQELERFTQQLADLQQMRTDITQEIQNLQKVGSPGTELEFAL